MKRVKVRHDLTGERFGRLLVLEQTDDWISPTSGDHKAQWLCQCDCGNKCKVTTGDLVSKNKQSCNCLHYETIADRHKYNEYNLDGEYGIGYTKDGAEFYFDLEDYDKIKEYRWTKENGYIVCYKRQNGQKYRIQMHRLLMGLPMKDRTQIVDHKNLQRNDNRKENLRICTYSQNTFNRNRNQEAKTNKSGYVGVNIVHSKTKGDRYEAVITANGVKHNLGYYDNLQDAINARIEGEIKYQGEFRYQGNEFFYPKRDAYQQHRISQPFSPQKWKLAPYNIVSQHHSTPPLLNCAQYKNFIVYRENIKNIQSNCMQYNRAIKKPLFSRGFLFMPCIVLFAMFYRRFGYLLIHVALNYHLVYMRSCQPPC